MVKISQKIIPDERIISQIYLIRGKKVMFDRDLAKLYGVETKALNRAVKRNIDRFPDDFMFQLSQSEANAFSKYQIGTLNNTMSSKSQIATLGKNLRYQNGTSSYGGRRYLPYVFTEQGVAMLSSVLKSKRAIAVNIQIMRTFTKIREMLLNHKQLQQKIEKMEKKYDENFKVVFKVIARLIKEDVEPKEPLGFR